MNEEFISLKQIDSANIIFNSQDFQYTNNRKKYADKIEAIWNYANNFSGKSYTNSNIFNVSQVKWVLPRQIDISGFFVEYKDYLAQKRDKTIKLDITPLGVSGIVKTYDQEDSEEKILFGKRTSNLTQYPNHFEMVPSGGIDDNHIENNCVLYKESLISEFEEELEINRNVINEIQVVAFVLDKKDAVYDILMNINTNSKIEPNKERKNNEYSDFIYVPVAGIKEFINQNIIVPTSLSILNIL